MSSITEPGEQQATLANEPVTSITESRAKRRLDRKIGIDNRKGRRTSGITSAGLVADSDVIVYRASTAPDETRVHGTGRREEGQRKNTKRDGERKDKKKRRIPRGKKKEGKKQSTTRFRRRLTNKVGQRKKNQTKIATSSSLFGFLLPDWLTRCKESYMRRYQWCWFSSRTACSRVESFNIRPNCNENPVKPGKTLCNPVKPKKTQ